MKKDDYIFESDSISEYDIENAICNYCGLSYVDSSFFDPRPSTERTSRVTIFKGGEGRVTCVITIGKGSEKKYSVKAYAIEFTKAR